MRVARGLLVATVLMAFPALSSVQAAFIPISHPDAAYVAGTSLLPITASDFDVVSSLSNGSQSVGFDIGMVALTGPATWGAWGSPPDTESLTPRVLWTNGLTSATLSTAGATTFGFELQPNTSVPSSFTVDFYEGASLLGSITRIVDGNEGALLFAATTTTGAFDQVVINGLDDFGIAQLRVSGSIAAVPEPTSLSMLAVGVFGLVALRCRTFGSKNKPAAAD